MVARDVLVALRHLHHGKQPADAAPHLPRRIVRARAHPVRRSWPGRHGVARSEKEAVSDSLGPFILGL
eukprot:1074642-Alexandrium_andersonii.AAC.1